MNRLIGQPTFDLDRYLEEQLALQKEAQRQEANPRDMQLERALAVMAVRKQQRMRAMVADVASQRSQRNIEHRGWAVRLNDRIEQAMAECNWRAIETFLERRAFPVFAAAVIFYFFAILAEAFMNGRFNVGGN